MPARPHKVKLAPFFFECCVVSGQSLEALRHRAVPQPLEGLDNLEAEDPPT